MSQTILPDDEIAGLLRERIGVAKRAPGGIIGIVDASGMRTIAHGRLSHGDDRLVSTTTLFEIGCATKVLTALLCADLIERGEIRLTDPLADYLPARVPTVGRNGVAIRLEHLITHTAGLPYHAADLLAPVEALFALLDEHVPRNDVGAYYQYSTFGFSLLGHALERRTGRTHVDLVRERICAPLGMHDTVVQVPPDAAPRVATGHNAGLAPIESSGTPTVTGGYGFRSTAADLLRLLAAYTGRIRSGLDTAIERTTLVRHRGAPGTEQVAMAWHVGTLNGREVVSHDGHTTGFRAFVGFAPGEGRGVVALLNGNAPIGVTDLCRHLLNPEYALLPKDAALLRPPREAPRGASVKPTCLDRYVGVYQLTPAVSVRVARDGDTLRLTHGSETQRLEPFDDREFWLPAAGLRTNSVVRFETSDDGSTTAMVVADRDVERRLTKVDESAARVWHGRRASETGPGSPQPYVGCYQFGEFVLDVRCEGQTLWAGWAGARPHELLHERDHRFLFKSDDVDVTLTFESGGDGHVVAVVCEMGHKRERGVRMPAMMIA